MPKQISYSGLAIADGGINSIILRLIEHFDKLGCKEFIYTPEKDPYILWLRWPNGKEQKLVVKPKILLIEGEIPPVIMHQS